MARYAMIDEASGIIVNVIEWDGDETRWRPPQGHKMVEDTEGVAGPGGSFKDGEFHPAPGGEPGPEPEPAGPPSLSPRQIRLALLQAGITEEMVDEKLADNPAGMIEWKHATVFERNHPLIEALAGGFDLSVEELDQMWQAAAKL